MAIQPHAAAAAGPPQLWFSPPDSGAGPRRTLTRERLVAEALAVIGLTVLTLSACAASPSV